MSALAELSLEVVHSLGDSVDPTTVAVLSVLVGGLGMSIRSVFDSIMSEEESDDESADSGEDLMGAGGGGGDDDLGGLGDFDEGDDEFGDFEDDGLGDVGEDVSTDELEHRLDELENEVGSLSSTVNTVRNENEQISETIDDVEENVRKLLDIYEMVTRGVNPFADDVDGSGFAGGGAEGSFGLFDEDDDTQSEDALDEDIAEAEPEGFFDEDLAEEPDDFDDVDDFGANEVETGDGGSDDSGGTDDGGDDGGGKSFQDLKDEYENGDAEWAEGDDDVAEFDGDDLLEEDADEMGIDEDDDLLEEDADEMGIDEDELADDELFDTVVDDEPDVDSPAETNEEMAAESAEESTAESAEEGAVEADQASSPGTDGDGDDPGTAGDESTDAAPDQRSTSTDAGAATDSTGFTTGSTGGDGKPYVERLPGGPVREIVTVEWLESLVDRLGTTNTRQALQYYERIGWISSEVRADLEAYLQGIEGDGTGANPDIEVHTTSLEYIRELNGTGRSSPLGGGGDPDGIQR